MIDARTAELLADLPAEAWTSGATCPTCEQHIKVYRRSITRPMVLDLMKLYEAGGTDAYCHLPTITGKNDGQASKLAYWHLIVPDPAGKGSWRCTVSGRDFLRGDLKLPRVVRTYNRMVIDFQGEPISVHDCFGAEFDLMAEMLA